MKLSLNNVVPDLRDHIDEGWCSFDELIHQFGCHLATLLTLLLMKQSGHLYVIHEWHYDQWWTQVYHTTQKVA